MLIITILLNFLFLAIQSRRRFRGGGGRAAGISKVTETFGKGVASLIKDIKQGNWGDEDYPEFNQKKGKREFNGNQYGNSVVTDTTFYVIVAIAVVVIVVLFLFLLTKYAAHQEQKSVVENMKKRHNQRFKQYEAVRMIAETGIHPDKAFGRLQKISYRDKKKD